MNSSRTRVSLIVATVGRYEELRALFASLAEQTLPAGYFEVILVDQNNVIDLTPIVMEFAHKIAIRQIRCHEKGLSRNRNLGLELASGDIVGFPDDDCKYYPDTLEMVMNLFDCHPEASIFLGAIHDREKNVPVIRQWPKEPQAVGKWDFFSLVSSITIFSKIVDLRFDCSLGAGGEFGSNEDADYLYHALCSGAVIRYDPGIQVWHPSQPILKVSQAKIEAYGIGFGAFILKNLSLCTTVLFLKVVLYHLAMALIAVCKLDLRSAYLRMIAAFSRINGIIQLVAGDHSSDRAPLFSRQT